jgi:hypothetical protein
MKPAQLSRMVEPAMAEPDSSPHGPIPIMLLNFATLGGLVAWLAVACYAFAYLVSH